MLQHHVGVWVVDSGLNKVNEPWMPGITVFVHDGVGSVILFALDDIVVVANHACLKFVCFTEDPQRGGGVTTDVTLKGLNRGISNSVVDADIWAWCGHSALKEMEATYVGNLTTTAGRHMEYGSKSAHGKNSPEYRVFGRPHASDMADGGVESKGREGFFPAEEPSLISLGRQRFSNFAM